MTRPIKFRAWDKKNEEMHTGFDLVFDGKEKLQSLRHDDWVQDDDFNPSGGFESPDDFIIMQFTGLYTGSNRELYEDDIIKINHEVRGEYVIGKIGFYRGGFALFDDAGQIIRFMKDGLGNEWHCLENYLPHEIEYLGNIYENPELLK